MSQRDGELFQFLGGYPQLQSLERSPGCNLQELQPASDQPSWGAGGDLGLNTHNPSSGPLAETFPSESQVVICKMGGLSTVYEYRGRV